MKLYKIFLAALCLPLFFTSCKKALDNVDENYSVASQIFNDSTLAILNVNYIYDQNLPTWAGVSAGSAISNPTGISDEAYADVKFFRGTLGVSEVGDIATAVSITNNYGKIRVINTFIRDVNAGSLPAATKNRLISQALFLRAFRYFDLVRLYGGVPLVLTPLEAVGNEAKEAAQIPRSKTSDCIKQITNDLDTCIKYLPRKWASSADWGRITSGAAAAFKGRVLITWASPQFVTEGASDPNAPASIASRWEDAYNACKQAVTLLGADWKLNTSYNNMWFTEVNNPEAVLVTGFNNLTTEVRKSNTYDNNARPSYLGTGGSATYQPTWEMVKAYPMLDGKVPGTSTKYTYNDQTFYQNRDPRFNATIAFNGATWPIIGNSTYRLWTYFINNRTVEPGNASGTSFYCRKAVDPSPLQSAVQFSGTDWMEIRYAEVLLNLAEAAAATNRNQEAYDNLYLIRARAGIEKGTTADQYGITSGLSGAPLINAVMYERQIEFAFEGKRFWDLRRRKLFASVLNGKVRTGRQINLNAGAPASLATSPYVGRDALTLDQAYTYFTIVNKQLDNGYTINWKDEYYFFGIPQSSIANNPKILQNKGWGGTFDPLQ
ncbi:RagB/SusD family nutrient uptake outer membrane protein [Mucilaginibacter aquatilis]|uniref:RagB/SusD family nutrient uptake outer membrane protein n=1 Tax=Mucilaginibacter aquatilis TaxID=1517760 RepID=A0A6I4I9C5_9SPHI|nr:RagB/SusD family nutrient uptake outer membrane protein [Mucilaginibacter aquatilis]MVN90069.1 RagB/SusD family nutrient uptake outer membrane protein [Mucilaginibacter aquatilis]